MPGTQSRRWWALGALALSVLVVSLDLTVLNLALPTLSRQLHATTSDLQWIVDSYSLVLAAALLPAGLLGDRFGRKRVLLLALALFGAGSVGCAFAGSAAVLIATRALLGLGAAAILPLALAVLPVFFTDAERPKAIAIVAGATFISYPAGPLLGGWLLDNFWWGSVFLINVPVVMIALAAVALLMPESRGRQGRRLDLAGMGVSSAGLAGITYGFIEAGSAGWSDGRALIAMAAGAALLAGFVAWERRAARLPGMLPLIDLPLFRSASFSWGTSLTTLVSFAMFGLLFAMPQYFQEVRGVSAFGSGLRMLPIIGGLMIGFVISGKLGGRPGGDAGSPGVSVKILVTAGFAVMAAALAAGAMTRIGSSTGFAAGWFGAAGLGLGLVMPAAMNAALGALTAERSGAGAAVISAMRQVGATIGVALLGTLLIAGYRARLHLGGLPAAAASAIASSVAGGVTAATRLGSPGLLANVRAAYVHGMDGMLWACAGVAVAAGLLAVAFLPGRPVRLAAAAAAADPESAVPALRPGAE